MATAARQLASLQTGGALDDIVGKYRGVGASWPVISRLLAAEHGIDLHPETLRRWYGARVSEPESAA